MTALMLTVALTVPAPALTVADWQAAHERFPRWIPAPPAVDVGPVERWRPLVAEHFLPEHVDDALSVMACESEGNPDAQHPGSHASGLYQAMPQWYTGRGWFEPSPFGPFDPFDPAENVRFAAWLFYDTGADWGPWVCQP